MPGETHKDTVNPAGWFGPNLRALSSVCAGGMVVLIAISALSLDTGAFATLEDRGLRLIAFAALTVWLSLGLGLHRRGVAAISVLAFASFLELFVHPIRGEAVGTLPAANLGIVLAWCSLQVYAWRAEKTAPEV
ncbi:MAG TPA: hypothetical protein PKV67_04370 [Hyphomonas sp.]|nr:hypothetical protein [Hyphomonas sp.]HRI99985.1 hypothetical protein [Hyphomonas sp.]HRK66296.1 hypothetical protein [Hyphomonas sp.]